ncbi:MAG: ABC transporter, ATP-binding protein, partial [uncultured Solirubrobacteraceae bacterium]
GPRDRAHLRRGRCAGPRAARGRRGVRARLVHRDHGTVGLGQVDSDARPRRPRRPDRRLGGDRRHPARWPVRPRDDAGATRPDRLRLPELQPAAGPQRRGEHPAAGDHRRRAPRFRVARDAARHRRPRGPAHAPPVGALGRPAAARRGRAGADQPARRRLRRRADRQPRLELGSGGALAAAARGRRVRPDDRDGHPRRRRGRRRRPRPVPGRWPDRRHGGAPLDRADPRPPQGLRRL